MYSKLTLIAVALMAWGPCTAQTCARINPYESGGGLAATIREPGKHCLSQDIKQSAEFDIHAGGYKSPQGPLLRIMCRQKKTCPVGDQGGNYQIDLGGYALTSDAEGMTGIDNVSGSATGVHIRNGSVSVRGPGSMGIFLWGERRAAGQAGEGGGRPPFMPTHHAIEHLTIRAGGQGVNVTGGNNILRNSVIEVDGHTAAYLFGPGSIVENNTFIVHGSGARSTQQAALQLREADGAVVRNNRFIFKGNWLRRGGVAISLLDSAGVTLAGNTFEGFEQHLLLDGATTATPDVVPKQ